MNTPPPIGQPVLVVVDHLSAADVRRILAVFDRPRGAPMTPGQYLDLTNALKLLPDGPTYVQLISLWGCLKPEHQAGWLEDGRTRLRRDIDSTTRDAAGAQNASARRTRGRRIDDRDVRGRILDGGPAFTQKAAEGQS